ncbi:hypothetical protein V6N11_044432 [Hibiscus sabdariffa]|uniref:Uncharacterized protein n=1 Tax=Hibiscus sabdariffa TaxID=183260 RepID=A0ABR2RFF5_9ROSI
MKIRKGRLETRGGFGLKTRKGRPEYTELGIPQGTLSKICASQNGSHIYKHHHLKRSLPNKGRNRGKLRCLDLMMLKFLISGKPNILFEICFLCLPLH